MTLVELMIVIAVLLIIFGAVFLFFTRGTEEFDYSRRQNELATEGRLALEQATDIILYAGWMPKGGWGNDQWHPVVVAEEGEFEFYADLDSNKVLDDTDYRNFVLLDGHIRVTDRGTMTDDIGSNIDSMSFNYLDQAGNPLEEPVSEADRDLVRHIQINLVLTDEYRNTEYSTEVSTTISPRNLGLNHNINPAFMPPDPLEGKVVFNVDGAVEPNPDLDQLLMINRMIDWGLTVIPLTDTQMQTYDFRGEGIDLILLKHREPPNYFPHTYLFYAYTGNKDTLNIPVVTMNATDAVQIFDMGLNASDMSNEKMWTACPWHPVNRDLPPDTSFNVYDIGSMGEQSVLSNLTWITPGDTVLTYPNGMSMASGVAVRDEDHPKRVVHFSAYDASEYTATDGWQIFYNVIQWNTGEPGHVIEREDFEDPEDYSEVEPGYGEDSYCWVRSPWTEIPPSTDDDYDARLSFLHCYWTRNRNAGAYLEMDTTWADTTVADWIQVPDSLLDIGYYHQQTLSGFPGGAGMDAWIDKSPGYSPSNPYLNLEGADLNDYRGKHVRFRWVFGVEDKESNNQDGYILDDPQVLLVGTDSLAGDTVRLDPWGLYPDSVRYQFRMWDHAEFPGYNDDWWYHHLFSVDPIYNPAVGYAWTTWGAIGYIGEWTHGGTNDSWEIGTMTLFYPDPDPRPTPLNGSHYVGQDLTQDDGLYNANETSYLLSEGWEVANTDPYDLIRLRIYRCVRNGNDLGWIHVGFSTDSIPPNPLELNHWYPKGGSGGDPWCRIYEQESHDGWATETISLTTAFEEAMVDSSYNYYWVLFSHSSGPGLEDGGWNLDNIEIVGDYEL